MEGAVVQRGWSGGTGLGRIVRCWRISPRPSGFSIGCARVWIGIRGGRRCWRSVLLSFIAVAPIPISEE